MKTHTDVVLRDPAEITPYAKNHKRHSQAEIDKLAAQIAAFGFDQPIVIDKHGVIIKGHKRRAAAMQLGLKGVPTITTDLDEYQAMAARIGDNHVITNDFDDDMLRFDLGTLQAQDVDMALTGMETDRIDAIMAEPEHDEEKLPATDGEPSGDKGLYISFDGQKVSVTEDELVTLSKRLREYEDDMGTRYGFFGHLCRK